MALRPSHGYGLVGAIPGVLIMNPSDLLDCRWYWREGLAVGAVLALVVRFVAVEVWHYYRTRR